MNIYLLLFIIFSFSIITIICCIYIKKNMEGGELVEKYHNANHDVYCLMITGKNNDREKFANNSILNFINQTYSKKHLIIINEGNNILLTNNNSNNDNIHEIVIDRKNMSLGELRNIALSFVPINGIWTTWDDDDWRSNDYIDKMYTLLIEKNVDIIMIMNRIEYNMNSGFIWNSTLKSGFIWFFGYKNWYEEFDNVNYNEEYNLKRHIRTKEPHFVYDNDPTMYIRIVHSDNTSVYVNSKKTNIINTALNKDYFEKTATSDQKIYVNNIIKKYYSNI